MRRHIGAGEALTGAPVGRDMEPRNHLFGDADAVPLCGRQHESGRNRETELDPPRPETPSHTGKLRTREPGEPAGAHREVGRKGKAEGRDPEMNASGRSYRPIVPAKQPNKARQGLAAEAVEGRGLAKGNLNPPPANRTLGRKQTLEGVDRVRQVARRNRTARFTALLHHVNLASLKAAFERTRKDAAAGIDGVTKAHYEGDLESNLERLHDLVHRGTYRPKPSRRVYILKEDGHRRPLAIGALEDKIVQGAVAEVLGAIYEEDFAGFSYGFRPQRNQHDALSALAVGIDRRKVSWILDMDIKSYFDSIDRKKLLDVLQIRIADKRILQLIQRWLDAGVVEDGELTKCKSGAPQGATISPLLSNVYLHYVFDCWAGAWRKRVARGDMILVRYADDVIAGFQHKEDAERFRRALCDRLGDYTLELHPDKTRLIEFGRFATERRARRGQGKPESFTFLGLRHICGTSRKGKFLLHRRTDKKRLRAKLKNVQRELRRRMHSTVPKQGAWLRSVIQGYFQYHAVPTNIAALRTFHTELARAWHRTLQRRSQRDHTTWEKMRPRIARWFPRPRILHSWPSVATLRHTQGRNPVR